jgi:hypothetical protein
LLSRMTRFGGDGYWWDDYAAALSFPFLVALTASQALAVRAGLGKDMWGLELDDFKDVIYVCCASTMNLRPQADTSPLVALHQ